MLEYSKIPPVADPRRFQPNKSATCRESLNFTLKRRFAKNTGKVMRTPANARRKTGFSKYKSLEIGKRKPIRQLNNKRTGIHVRAEAAGRCTAARFAAKTKSMTVRKTMELFHQVVP